MRRPSFLVSFSRSQISAFIATIVDVSTLLVCVEVLRFWYVPSTAMGAALGAVTNFALNRYWSFEAADGRWETQAWKYALVSTGSLLLNTAGVYAVTEGFHFDYRVSKIIVALAVGFFYNFPLHRNIVFRT